jgi:hypothetical protein
LYAFRDAASAGGKRSRLVGGGRSPK